MPLHSGGMEPTAMVCQITWGSLAVHLEVSQCHLILFHDTVNSLFDVAIKDSF